MEIQIDKIGHLKLKRGKQLRPAGCPHVSRDEAIYCGDWCASFREYREDIEDDTYHVDTIISIELCDTIHQCKLENFQDDRE